MPASVDEAIRARVAVQEFSVKRVTKLFFDWIAKVEDKAMASANLGISEWPLT